MPDCRIPTKFETGIKSILIYYPIPTKFVTDAYVAIVSVNGDFSTQKAFMFSVEILFFPKI